MRSDRTQEAQMTDYERTTVQRTVDEPDLPPPTTAPLTPAPLTTAPLPPAIGRPVRSSTVHTERTVERTRRRPDVVGLVTLVFGILQTLLLLRVLLLLLIANDDNTIVAGILAVTDPFVEPFRGMFRLDHVSGRSGSVLDIAALVALVGWTLVEALIVAVLRLGDRHRTVDA
jgi:uncharacterized protein YggT (Ycf19 family)